MMTGLWKKNKHQGASRAMSTIKIQSKGQHSRIHSPLRQRMLLKLAIAIASLVGFFLAFVSTSPMLLLYHHNSSSSSSSSNAKQKTILINNHSPLLLLPNKQQQENMHQHKNVLRKPFQWYRDHWYNTNDPPSPRDIQKPPVWHDTQLPLWMKDYFEWHHKQQEEPTSNSSPLRMRNDFNHNSKNHTTITPNNNNNNNNKRYLILQCLEQDRQCGGLADRLLVLPFLVLVAAQSQRQLKIVWTVPFPLEEFLMPHTSNSETGIGVDWMLPAATASTGLDKDIFLSQDVILSTPSVVDKTVFVRVTSLLEAVHRTDLPVVRARIQDYTSAWDYYDQYHAKHYLGNNNSIKERGTNFAEQHYRELFFVLFQPSPPLVQAMNEKHVMPASLAGKQVISKEKQEQNIALPSDYAVAHYRSLYGSQIAPSMEYMTAASKNAVNCASQLLPGGPIVFLSDSTESAQTLMGTQATRVFLRTNTKMTSRTNTAIPEPLHLDKATRQQRSRQSLSATTTQYEPSDFYDTFLDLFLMARARCVSFGQGGFGKMGSLLSGNRTCTNRHFEYGKMVSCARKG